MAKSEKAISTAQLLLKVGDHDGASNRAYYAMHDAARAALLAHGAATVPNNIKTHSGVMTAFAQHLVKDGLFEKQMLTALKRVEQIRMVADYNGDSVDPATAKNAVDQAVSFVGQIKRTMPKQQHAPQNQELDLTVNEEGVSAEKQLSAQDQRLQQLKTRMQNQPTMTKGHKLTRGI